MSDFPWFADGLSENEERVVRDWKYILQHSPAAAETLSGFSWLADAITREEAFTIYHFRRLLRNNPAMAEAVLEAPWFSDGITSFDRRIVSGLRNVYDLAQGNISALTTRPWYEDGLSHDEFMLVGGLGDLARRSEPHFLKVIDMPFLETFEPADALAARTMWRLACCGDGVSEDFLRVMAHPTVGDGISDEEAKIVATLQNARFYRIDIFDQLLDPDTVTLEERTIDLPHTGETQLTIIRIRPGLERTMDLLERVVRTVEGFVQMPFPVGNVIYLTEDTYHGASNAWSNMTGEHEQFDTDEYSEVDAMHVIAHETAHYYWFSEWTLHWVEDGLGAFFQSYIKRQAQLGPDEPVAPIWRAKMPPCPIPGHIAGLEILEREHGIKTDCSDSLGERLFQDLWRNLGWPVFQQGLANLHLLALKGSPVGECEFNEYDKAGICQVRAAFRDAAPPEADAIVDKVISRWYDGGEPYDLSHVDASQPNPNLTSGLEIARAYISLGRDRPASTETDRFSAGEVKERVYLNLLFSSPGGRQAQNLPLTFVEYFEDGFPYRIRNSTYHFSDGYGEITRTHSVGAGPGYTWIAWGDWERPPTWAQGRYWVQVYHGEQKVAEVEWQVTP